MPINPDSVTNFIKNLFMLQGHPGRWGGPSFGTGGQLTTIAIEFHIYFLVGGAFFFCLGRQRFAAAVIAIIFAATPLAYFSDVTGSVTNLFVLWLLGFAAFFIARFMVIDRTTIAIAAIMTPIFAYYWITKRTPENEYALRVFPMFALTFLTLAVSTQGTRLITPVARKWISAFADCSYSLFLIHFTLQKMIIYWFAASPWAAFAAAIILPNIAAYYFAVHTEAKHKKVAARLIEASQPAIVRHSRSPARRCWY